MTPNLMTAPPRLTLGVLQLNPEDAPGLAGLPGRLEPLAAAGAQILLLPEFWNAAFEGGGLARGALASEEELAPLLAWSALWPDCCSARALSRCAWKACLPTWPIAAG